MATQSGWAEFAVYGEVDRRLDVHFSPIENAASIDFVIKLNKMNFKIFKYHFIDVKEN